MGRAKRKSASKVAAVAAPDSSPATPLKRGKREAEVVIEKELVSAKKQKALESEALESEKKPKAKTKAKKRKPDSESHSDISGVEAVAAKNVAAPPPNGRSDEDVVVPATSPEKTPGEDEPAPKEQSTGRGGGFKTLFIKNLSFQVKKEDVLEFFKPAGEVVDVRLAKREFDSFKGKAYIDFATAEQAEKALLELNGKKLMHRAVRLAKEEKQGEEPNDGKTLFAYNISFQAQKEDILEFFKPAEGLVDVRLIMRESDEFKGYGYVDFATAEQAEKALLELNGKELFERKVRLIIAREPKKGEYRQPLKRRAELEVFVTGFDAHEGEDNIRASLMDHFAPCGEIAWVSIPTGPHGKPVGLAYVQFLNENARSKALELGTETMVVEVPRPKADRNSGGFGSARGGGAKTMPVGDD